jgi:tautomerase-like protein
MPLVRIDLHQGHAEEELAAIGDVVHRAMVETIAVPADDRFQVITEHPSGRLIYDRHYLDVNRDDGSTPSPTAPPPAPEPRPWTRPGNIRLAALRTLPRDAELLACEAGLRGLLRTRSR